MCFGVRSECMLDLKKSFRILWSARLRHPLRHWTALDHACVDPSWCEQFDDMTSSSSSGAVSAAAKPPNSIAAPKKPDPFEFLQEDEPMLPASSDSASSKQAVRAVTIISST